MNKLKNITKRIKYRENEVVYIWNTEKEREGLFKLLTMNTESELDANSLGKIYNDKSPSEIRILPNLDEEKNYLGLYAEIDYKYGMVIIEESLQGDKWVQNFTYIPKWHRKIYNYLRLLYRKYIKKEEIFSKVALEYEIKK